MMHSSGYLQMLNFIDSAYCKYNKDMSTKNRMEGPIRKMLTKCLFSFPISQISLTS